MDGAAVNGFGLNYDWIHGQNSSHFVVNSSTDRSSKGFLYRESEESRIKASIKNF